ncbi:MAG: primosomal protein N' [Candidatus Omnitrophica bacterium]|nr:primosomal protein N' [Candidatus Omnitrophota bacterium]
MKKNVALVVVGLPVEGPFDYAVDPAHQAMLEPGMRVRVFFNRRKMVGYVVGFRDSSPLKRLNTIIAPLENSPSLNPAILAWTQAAAAYYGCSWGDLIELIYPAVLRRGKYIEYAAPLAGPTPRESGQKALISGYLLGEGTDKIWVEIVNATLAAGRSVLIVTPDKFYAAYYARKIKTLGTHQTISYEKKLNVAKQVEQFQAVRSGCPCVIVGTRSAVFAPHGNLGHIIVVHDEHDWHKSEQSPHYRTDKVALLRGAAEGTDVSFLSLNPRVELRHQARQNAWGITNLEMGQQARLQLVDLDNYTPGKSSILSFPVQNNIRATLEAKGRVLLYFNRKGFMIFTRCQQCGHTLRCPRCDTHLVLRHATKKLSCHGCGYIQALPQKCPQCTWPYMRSTGMGIEKLESEAHRYYPQARISVLDKDTRSLPKHVDLLLATSAIFNYQMAFQADQVIMLDYDQGLHHSDYRSAHKSLTTLLMLKAMAKDKLTVQTRMPDDSSIRAAQQGDLEGFFQGELKTREELCLPPYVDAAALVIRGEIEERVWTVAGEILTWWEKNSFQDVTAGDPYPDIRPKLRDQYRCTIMLKSPRHEALMLAARQILKEFRSKRQVIITLDVDP